MVPLRVRAATGIPIEDIGVQVPERDVHPTSRRNLLAGNADLLQRATARLFGPPQAPDGAG